MLERRIPADEVRRFYVSDLAANPRVAELDDADQETVYSVILRAVDDAIAGRAPSPIW